MNYENEKTLIIQTERRTDSRFPRLTNYHNRLVKEKKLYLRSWGKTIKSFCQNCKKLIKAPNQEFLEEETDSKIQVKEEEERDQDTASETPKRGHFKEDFSKGCSIQFRSYFRGSESRLTQIIVNESLIQMLGYNVETFCSQVLSEGLPE